MKVVIAGKNNIAVNVTEFLLGHSKVSEIISIHNSNDMGVDQHQRSYKKYCEERNIKVAKIEDVYNEGCDVFISLEFDKIVNPSKFKHEKIYNIHFSKLPAYKGMYTSALPILNNEKESGVTLHFIDEGIDTGDIIAQRSFTLSKNETAKTLYEKYIELGTDLVLSYVDDMLNGTCKRVPQSAQGASYFSKHEIDYQNIVIDLRKTAIEIKKQIDGYSFREYQLVELFDNSILGCEVLNVKSKDKPGKVSFENERYFDISTIDYDLRIYKDVFPEMLEAITVGDIEQVRNLVNNYNLNERDSHGWSPVIVAAYHGRKEILKYLISLGANVNDINYKGTTVFMYAKNYALFNNDISFLEELIGFGADIYKKDFQGFTVFDYVKNEGSEYDFELLKGLR